MVRFLAFAGIPCPHCRAFGSYRHQNKDLRIAHTSGTMGVACNMALMAQQNPYVQLNRRPYFVIFFVKGEAWAQPRTKEETDRLLRGHLAYLRKHVESGQYALSGPLNDDGPVRGIIVLSAGTA